MAARYGAVFVSTHSETFGLRCRFFHLRLVRLSSTNATPSRHACHTGDCADAPSASTVPMTLTCAAESSSLTWASVIAMSRPPSSVSLTPHAAPRTPHPAPRQPDPSGTLMHDPLRDDAEQRNLRTLTAVTLRERAPLLL